MHYNIEYEDRDKPEVQRKACADTLNWFGSKRYRILTAAIKSGIYSEEQIRFYASIGGVQGFPITAMWNRYDVAHD